MKEERQYRMVMMFHQIIILTYILKSAPEDTQWDYEEMLDHFITFFIAGTT